MGDQYLGEIQAFPFPFAEQGFNNSWLPCAGQLLPVQQYAALFSLIGTYYGGNGTTNFALPNMIGTVSNSQGQGPGLQPRTLGQTIGAATVPLTLTQLPGHTHTLQLGSDAASGGAPGPGTSSNMAAISPNPPIDGFVAPPSNTTLSQNAVAMTGQGLPHDNMQPTQAIVWCIAVSGVFPSFS